MSENAIGRRSFLKLAALGASSVAAFGENNTLRAATEQKPSSRFRYEANDMFDLFRRLRYRGSSG